jgi:hypothetical protein
VADGVDASVDAVQAAGGNPSGHAVLGDPTRQELRNRDHSVLSRGDLGN